MRYPTQSPVQHGKWFALFMACSLILLQLSLGTHSSWNILNNSLSQSLRLYSLLPDSASEHSLDESSTLPATSTSTTAAPVTQSAATSLAKTTAAPAARTAPTWIERYRHALTSLSNLRAYRSEGTPTLHLELLTRSNSKADPFTIDWNHSWIRFVANGQPTPSDRILALSPLQGAQSHPYSAQILNLLGPAKRIPVVSHFRDLWRQVAQRQKQELLRIPLSVSETELDTLLMYLKNWADGQEIRASTPRFERWLQNKIPFPLIADQRSIGWPTILTKWNPTLKAGSKIEAITSAEITEQLPEIKKALSLAERQFLVLALSELDPTTQKNLLQSDSIWERVQNTVIDTLAKYKIISQTPSHTADDGMGFIPLSKKN